MGKIKTLWNRAVTTIYTGRNNLKITKKIYIYIQSFKSSHGARTQVHAENTK